MKSIIIKKVWGVLLFLSCCMATSLAQTDLNNSVKKIWDSAPHSAFTDLIEFKVCFYCAFREGTEHEPGKESRDGEIRILVSDDGESWSSFALLTRKGYDLRDSKFSITPDGRLMVLMGGTVYDKGVFRSRMPHVSFSDKKGGNFSDPKPLTIDASIRSNFE